MRWQDIAKILAGGTTTIGLLTTLFLLTGISYTYTGDITCGETCESYINVTSNYWKVCFEVSNKETITKKSRTLYVNLNKINNIISTNPEVKVDLLIKNNSGWNDISGYCWDRKELNQIKLVGYKKSEQTVKWSFDLDRIKIDPTWNGVKVTRTASSDLYENGQKTLILYSGVVNIRDINNKFQPYTEVTNFTIEDDRMLLNWHDKSIILDGYIKKNNQKQKLKDINLSDLELKHNKYSNRGNYYYTHELTKDSLKKPDIFGYDVNTFNVSCGVKGHSLICAEQTLDFSKAVNFQNLNVSIFRISPTEFTIEFSGVNISNIDPQIIPTTNVNNTYSIEAWSSVDCTATIQAVPHPGCIYLSANGNPGLQASDNSYLGQSGGANDTGTTLFKYRFVDGKISQIINVTWEWEGKVTNGTGEALLNATHHIWNDSLSNWILYNSTTDEIDTIKSITFTNTTTINNSIFNASNWTHIIAQGFAGTTNSIDTDFVRLIINYDSYPTFRNVTENKTYAVAIDNVNFTAEITDDILISSAWLTHNFDLVNKSKIDINSGVEVWILGGIDWYGQTFRSLNGTQYLKRACIQIANHTSISGVRRNITFEIRATSNGRPTGANLTTKYQVVGNTIGIASTQCVDFIKPFLLTKNVQYVLLLSATDSETRVFDVIDGTPSSYPNGTEISSSTNQSTWDVYSPWDSNFNLTFGLFDKVNETFQSINAISTNASFSKTLNYAPSIARQYQWCANDSRNQLNCSITRNYTISEIVLIDTINATGNITSPPNNTRVNGNVTIDASANDNNAVNYVSFQSRNSTSISYTNMTFCDRQDAPFECRWDTSNYSNNTGGHEIRIVPCDIVGNCNYTIPSRLYIIDRGYPTENSRQIIYPSLQTSIRNTQTLWFQINVSDADSGINTTQIDLINLNGTRNSTMILNNQTSNLTFGNTSIWNISIVLSGTTTNNNTKILYFIYDNVTPSNNILINSFPVNIDNSVPTWDNISNNTNSAIYNNSMVIFTLNAFDNNNLLNYTFSNNFSGSWVNISNNFTGDSQIQDIAVNVSNVTVGNSSWRFYLYDDAGNLNTSTLQYIEVLGTPPPSSINISLIRPANGTVSANSVIVFEYNYSLAQASSCALFVNTSQLNITNSPTVNTSALNLTGTLGNGDDTWFIQCNNTINSIFRSDIRRINVSNGTGAADTCSYTSGNWAVTCGDNCTISSNVIGTSGANLSITGTGEFILNANISNFTLKSIGGVCRVRCTSVGCFKIIQPIINFINKIILSIQHMNK